MRHGSLFSGIGGFDLASEWMGWENVFHCEWNPFGQKVLNYYWPNAITYHDIKKTDFTIHRGRIDIITGGFPCQPYSSAGKRLGKEDERHLWPEMLRAIREIQPTWVVGENVRGLTNWNGGLVFDEVQAELETQGYEVTPFLLPACAVNAPHRRDRIWFIAYSKINRQSQSKGIDKWEEHKQDNGDGIRSSFDTNGSIWITSDSDLLRCDQRIQHNEVNTGKGGIDAFGDIDESDVNGDATNSNGFGLWGQINRSGKPRFTNKKSKANNWKNFPTVSPIRMRDDGISTKLSKFVVNEFYDTDSNTSKENRIENLSEVWARISQEEIWEQIRGFYSLESKEILFQTMQLYSGEWVKQRQLSPFSENVCEPIMQNLRKYGQFRCSPQGQELEKQRHKQFGDSMSFLPHEIALAAGRFETSMSKFENWHRNESIKAGGNAIVPQVVYQIFKAIEKYNELDKQLTI
jgi:DNA (cytosine-5)-methyltransferase 1